MIDIKLDSSGDIDFTNGQMRLTESIEESTYQQILITLNTFRGEWFADIEFGIPYLENDNNSIHLLGKTSKTLIDTYIIDAVLARENVEGITLYRSAPDHAENTLVVTMEVLTTTGSTIQLETSV